MRIYEQGKVFIIDEEDGGIHRPITLGHGRFRYEDGGATTVITDEVLLGERKYPTNTIEDGAGAIISNSGNDITDMKAMTTYLGGFIG